jgi:formylglycine-generating enzyme required for sulfatase activity
MLFARAAREQAERDKAAREEAARQRAEQEQLARAQAERERLERERAAQEKLEREKLEQEQLAREQAERERLEQERLVEQRAAEREATERAAREEAAREEERRREQERSSREQAEQARLPQESFTREEDEQEEDERNGNAFALDLNQTQLSVDLSQTQPSAVFGQAYRHENDAATVDGAADEAAAHMPQAAKYVNPVDTSDTFLFPESSRPASSTVQRLIIIIAVSFVLLIITAAAIALFSNRDKSRTSTPATGTEQARVEPVAPEGMVYVPGGAFKMGRDDGTPNERPAHEARLKPFFIESHEVTNEQYRKFVAATGHGAPLAWENGQYPKGSDHWPVTGVNWDDATAYAAWAGRRLPTEEEWEFAARGTDGRLYPWGNQWESEKANTLNTAAGHVVDVAAFKGASPFGLYDMVGNAWEWTASDWAAYPGGRLATSPAYPDMKVMRGNFWGAVKQEQATTTYRIGWPANVKDSKVSYTNAGFRCAKDAPTVAQAN